LKRPRNLAWAAGTLCALVLAACEMGDTGTPAAASSPSSSGPPLQATLVASQLLVGTQRFPIGVLSRNTPVIDARVHVRAFFVLANSAQARGQADAPFKGDGLQGKGLYVAQLAFDTPGQWLAIISVSRPDGSSTSVNVPFKVTVKGAVPGVGDEAPKSHNQTLKDVPDVSYVDSGVPPNDMHQLSIADAIDQHRPALVVFATPGFCSSATCGPQVRAVEALEPTYRSRLAFIHVEIYRDFKPDPSKRQLTPTVLEWHLQTEPWVFLIDRMGVIRAAFEAATATDDLLAGIDRMLAAG
jgi:hypothetical protein